MTLQWTCQHNDGPKRGAVGILHGGGKVTTEHYWRCPWAEEMDSLEEQDRCQYFATCGTNGCSDNCSRGVHPDIDEADERFDALERKEASFATTLGDLSILRHQLGKLEERLVELGLVLDAQATMLADVTKRLK